MHRMCFVASVNPNCVGCVCYVFHCVGYSFSIFIVFVIFPGLSFVRCISDVDILCASCIDDDTRSILLFLHGVCTSFQIQIVVVFA